jgi:hypothetical protein
MCAMMQSEEVSGVSGILRPRRIELARRTCVIGPNRIAVRPSAAALLPPLLGLATAVACFVLIVADVAVWRGALPFALLVLLLFVAVIFIPLSGMGLIYAAIGANVLIDRDKMSATWQQGLLGLGVGTTELVPFWKIDAIAVDETASDDGRSTEEIAQWEIALCKKSGSRLAIGRVSAARSLARPSFDRAAEVAGAIAALTGASLRLPEPPAS